MELELKVSALPGEELQEEVMLTLADTRLGLVGEVQQLMLEAHYHDDNQGLLRGLGWALRARVEGNALVATAKGPPQDQDGVPARPEINAPLESMPAAGDLLPEPLADALNQAGVQLNHWPGAQWVTKVQRTLSDLCLPKGGRAELAIDHGFVRSGTKSHPIIEFELELREGEANELITGIAILSEGLAVRPGGRSKAARGLQLLGRLEPPEKEPQDNLKNLWKQNCELEEWLREGHKELQEDYLETATKLLKKLSVDTPDYLRGSFETLRAALDSPAHAKLLWRIFSTVYR